MALDGVAKDDDVKTRFRTREGIYRQMPIFEYFCTKQVPYASQGTASTTTTVKTSFVKLNDGGDDPDRICFHVGRELFYVAYNSLKQPAQHPNVLDKRTYKGVAPTCHSINQHTASSESVKVAVGFTAGQVQIIDVQTKESLQIMNENRSVEKSKVTCVRWYPKSKNMLISAHMSGHMYTYDIAQQCSSVLPTYHSQPHKAGDGYTVYALKTKNNVPPPSTSNGGAVSSNNPIYKWVMSTSGAAVHAFEFSPCGRFLAIVMQDGYLRIIDHETFEMVGYMKSYFGGLLSCCWSPDSRYVVTGGEDDLVTVWSFCEKCVVARGNGHRSWVSEVAFDPYVCAIPSDSDMINYYAMPSVSDVYPSAKSTIVGRDSTNNNSSENIAAFNAVTPTQERRDLSQNVKGADRENHLHCNGDAGVLPLSAMRRLRTYSNVSKFSRMSIGLDPTAPSICYRFGSVGQDAHLCLWELDENALYFSRRSQPTLSTQKRRSSIGAAGDAGVTTLGSNGAAETSSDAPVSDSFSDFSNSGGSAYHYYSDTTGNLVDPLFTTHSSSTPHSINHSASTPKNRKSQKNISNGVVGKFATLGSHERKRKEEKEHKRNLSLPHFSLRTTSSQNGGHLTKHGLLTKKTPQLQEPKKTLGTILCPKLEETTMLEPLVCKKITQNRITGIHFMEDSVVTTYQEGSVQIWKRPHKPTSLSCEEAPSPPKSVPGTMV